MVHAALLILLIMALGLLGALWLAVVGYVFMRSFLEFWNTDVMLLKLGIRLYEKHKLLAPGLFPVAAKIVSDTSTEQTEMPVMPSDATELSEVSGDAK